MYILNCYFDGACEPNNPGGTIGWGWCLTDDEKEPNMQAEGCGWVAPYSGNTNNVAEYLALKNLIEHLIDSGDCVDADVRIMGDSQLVIKQMNGDYKIGEGAYVRFAKETRELLAVLKGMSGKISFHWIPREENVVADILSKKGVELYDQEMLKVL